MSPYTAEVLFRTHRNLAASAREAGLPNAAAVLEGLASDYAQMFPDQEIWVRLTQEALAAGVPIALFNEARATGTTIVDASTRGGGKHKGWYHDGSNQLGLKKEWIEQILAGASTYDADNTWLGTAYNEAFHAVYNKTLKRNKEMYGLFKSYAEILYRAGGNGEDPTHFLDEAFSETVMLVARQYRSSTHAKRTGLTGKNWALDLSYDRVATAPQHDDPGQQWDSVCTRRAESDPPNAHEMTHP